MYILLANLILHVFIDAVDTGGVDDNINKIIMIRAK